MRIVTLLIILISFAFSSQYILVDKYYSDKIKKEKYNKFLKTVQDDGTKITLKQDRPLKIYMVYPGNQVSDYWRRSKISFEARLKELGISYKLIDHFTKPSVEISKQAYSLLEALQNDTDYLIFTLDASKHLKLVSFILQQKKPKLILQNITTPLKQLEPQQPFLYDGFDHTIGAKYLADEYIRQVGKKGKYAVFYGSVGYVSSMRGDYFIEYISKKSDLELVQSYYIGFNKQKAREATFDLLLNHQDIDFIYACSTDIALGIIDALKEKKLLGKIKVNGWGGGSAELDSIQKNEMDFTVMRMNDDNGVAMAEAIKLDFLGKSNEVPLIYSGEFRLIKKGIHPQELFLLKSRAFRYSGQ